ncbi:ABC transporter related protein [Cellulomonas flavigena DSM 20109]|uniref:ABC-type quaternary amine transporter n=1 Tax=Cellulomonas flavigena (strain ATCC 482 / DSM 20109 / BCRC 11376 / JCM 18109 / NBRC 3775 / NCIMB 8073 / NRS 134) TaxID=446466 RepID=D5UGF6_CELFN|nr:ABC transporter ATP-binding protein [Cellulomonas flavigena]ADG73139.1 ABC transporter related protein [Cellulomonas flavigena DSM 20109]
MSDGLQVADVVVRYAGAAAAAVDGVDLAVPTGEVLALLGPSGCGKSSLLRAVAGLEPLTGGDVAWDGVSVAEVPVHRRGFGLLFQDGQLFAHRDVAGNVAYGLPAAVRRDRAARTTRVAELLDLVGLPGTERRDVATLSGGERQRVALARALAPRPRLLLLDEPLSALDRALRERLALDLRDVLVATGTTALFVTHDQDEAFAVADRVAVMDSGRLLQVAPPAALWARPASRRVAQFLGYEAFVDVPATGAVVPAAVRALVDAVGAAGVAPVPTGGVLALVAGAFVVDPTTTPAPPPADRNPAHLLGVEAVSRVPVGGVVGGGGERGAARGDVSGVVRAVRSRRGRTEVVVDVDGVGTVSALAPAGWTCVPGARVALQVDAAAVAGLPG